MAHRQLAEDYRAKLKNANDRIFELEGTIADLQADLEQSKQLTSAQPSTEQLAEAEDRIDQLDKALAQYKNRLEHAVVSTNANEAAARQEVVAGQSRIKELEHRLSKSEDWTGQLDRLTKVPAGDAAVELMNLRRQLDSARSDEYELRLQIDKLRTTETVLREQLAGNGADVISSEVYRGRLDNAAAVESALRTQAKNWEKRAGKAESKIEKVKADVERRDAYIVRLKALLQREKDARVIADSKAAFRKTSDKGCKTCNAIVIDLDVDDDEDMGFEKPTPVKAESAESRTLFLTRNDAGGGSLVGSNEFKLGLTEKADESTSAEINVEKFEMPKDDSEHEMEISKENPSQPSPPLIQDIFGGRRRGEFYG